MEGSRLGYDILPGLVN